MTYVIDTAYQSGGNFYVDGTDLGYGCSASGTWARLGVNPSDSYALGLPHRDTFYITESVYNTLKNDGEWGVIRPRVKGVVKDDHLEKVRCTFLGDRLGYVYRLKIGVIIPNLPVDDSCKDVSCPDMCIGVDKYNQVCQDGICVRGTLIGTDSVHCGYTPEPTPDPTPDPTPTPSSDTFIIIALMLAGTYIILRR